MHLAPEGLCNHSMFHAEPGAHGLTLPPTAKARRAYFASALQSPDGFNTLIATEFALAITPLPTTPTRITASTQSGTAAADQRFRAARPGKWAVQGSCHTTRQLPYLYCQPFLRSRG